MIDDIITELEGYCPSCSEQTTFEYEGTQRFKKRNIEIELYTCQNDACRSTVSLHSILAYTEARENIEQRLKQNDRE